jgi:hypothetical protein
MLNKFAKIERSIIAQNCYGKYDGKSECPVQGFYLYVLYAYSIRTIWNHIEYIYSAQ